MNTRSLQMRTRQNQYAACIVAAAADDRTPASPARDWPDRCDAAILPVPVIGQYASESRLIAPFGPSSESGPDVFAAGKVRVYNTKLSTGTVPIVEGQVVAQHGDAREFITASSRLPCGFLQLEHLHQGWQPVPAL